jgi:heme/copper-type cytochrome/quinol oxidase subunit 2
MGRAIVVVALSFGAGAALAALAILVNRAALENVNGHSPPSGEPTAAEPLTSIERQAPRSPPRDSLRSPPIDSPPTDSLRSSPADAIGDDTHSLPGWAPGSDRVELQLTGVNYEWLIRYPDPPGSPGSSGKPGPGARASQEIHLPAETDLRLHLKSRDFVYLITVPSPDGGPGQRSQIAVPNHLFTLDFNTGPEGTLVIRGDHLCGLPRPSLDLSAIVQSEEEFQAWLDDQGK